MYNSKVATSTPSLYLNSVAVLFVMEVDEYCFSLLGTIDKKWTKYVDESDDTSSGEKAGKKKKKDTLAAQDANNTSQESRIASQQEEIGKLVHEEMKKEIVSQQEEMFRQKKETSYLREEVQNLQEAQSTAPPQCAEGMPREAKVEGTKTETEQSYLSLSSETLFYCSNEGEAGLESISPNSNNDEGNGVLLNANTIATHQDFGAA